MTYQRKTADILISDELKEILIEIESESIVAYKLLRKRHQIEDLVEGYVNYISISRQDRSRISYLTKDREELLTPEEYWTSSKRYHTKPGGFISKIFSNITQAQVEKFSNLFRTEALKPKFRFDVVSGNDIKKYYSYESYAEDGRGSLGISCMKHNSSQQLLDVYTEGKEFVSMLVMLNSDDRLVGRSLLWNTDRYKIMDRIYTHDDEKLQHHFKKWATSNGYLYKSEQNWFNTLFFEKMGSEKKEIRLEIKMNADFRYLPYMDTFKFIDQETGFLYNYIPDGKNIGTLCSCDGGRHDSDYLRFDGIDRVFRYRGEAPYVDYLNMFTHERNLNWSNIYNKYILKESSFYNQEIGDYIFNEEFDHLNDQTIIESIMRKLRPTEEILVDERPIEENLGDETREQTSLADYVSSQYYSSSSRSNFMNILNELCFSNNEEQNESVESGS